MKATPKSSTSATTSTPDPSVSDRTQTEIDKLAAEGFSKVATSVHYYAPGESDVLFGVPLVRQQREAKSAIDPANPGFYYLIMLTRPCAKLRAPGKKTIDGKPGEIVHLDERHQVRVLEHYLPRDVTDPLTGEVKRTGFVEVVVMATEKVSTGKGIQTVWLFDVHKRVPRQDAVALLASVDVPQLAVYVPEDETQALALPGASENAQA